MRSMIANWPAAGPSAPVHIGVLGLAEPAGQPHPRALGVAALIAWLLTVSLGAYMARAWVGSGGLRRRRASDDDFPPAVLLGHASLAVTGLLLWAGYLASGLAALAWAATGVLAAAIGLGVSTVTLWTPYPVRQPLGPRGTLPEPGAGPGFGDAAHAAGDGPPHGPLDGPDPPAFEVTDEMLHALLSSPAPARRRRRPQALIPLFHGIGAITTFLLAVLTAVGTL
jgi:hypothetical protein